MLYFIIERKIFAQSADKFEEIELDLAKNNEKRDNIVLQVNTDIIFTLFVIHVLALKHRSCGICIGK